jgi:hypothetical protein
LALGKDTQGSQTPQFPVTPQKQRQSAKYIRYWQNAWCDDSRALSVDEISWDVQADVHLFKEEREHQVMYDFRRDCAEVGDRNCGTRLAHRPVPLQNSFLTLHARTTHWQNAHTRALTGFW